MNENQRLVREFHQKFGLTINDTPTPSPADDILRVNLIHEEACELWQAERDADRVAIADALGDLAYVIYGAGVTYGVEVFGMERGIASAVGILNGNAGLAESLQGGDPLSVETDLRYLMSDVHALAENHHIPHDSIFREIHRSNLSKGWTDEEICEHYTQGPWLGVPWFKPEESPIVSRGHILAFIPGNGVRCWCVKKLGKVIKSPSYSPANLAPILAAQ